MKSTQYSEKTLDHFRNPRNVGTLKGADVSMGRVGNPVCGDLMEIYIRVEDDRIRDIKFQTFGCGSAVATSSMITELVKGMTLDEAMEVTRSDVADALEGLPPVKMHCSNLAADALHEAIRNWRRGKQPEPALSVLPPYMEKACEVPKGPVKGELEYLGRGVYKEVSDFSEFRDKRVLVLDSGKESAALAAELDKHTGRIVFVTTFKESSTNADLKRKLNQSDVKVLYESELLEIKGEKEVEQVVIHDLNEDHDYELFVDAVVIPGR